MEHWEDLLQQSSSSDLRYYIKVLKTAERVFKEDLAPFEIEWITETLLFKPLSLLETISTKRTDEAWWKTIGDAFKVLAGLVNSHWGYVDNYYEDLMKLCLLSYDAQTRKQAIHCVIAMLRRAPGVCGDVTRHVSALEAATTCKAPLALLVGTLCEYHDGEVNEEFQRIWRIYLNMLGANKYTVTILVAVLQGILALFSKFGGQLRVDQLNSFYDALSRDYLQAPRCEHVVFSILNHHGNLFKERLAADQPLRSYMWNVIEQKTDKDAASAVKSVYDIIFTVMDKSKIESTLNTEIIPKTDSTRTLVKYTALRILSRARAVHSVSVAVTQNTDCLEFEMRAGAVSYETAEAISWCIECNMSNSDRLLQAAILFCDNLPAAKRSDILINGILNAPDDVRRTAVTFLISQSIQDPSSVEKCQPLWTDLLRTSNSAGDRSSLVFEDAVSYLIDRYTEINQDNDETPSNLTSLLSVTSHVLSAHSAFAVGAACAALLPCAATAARRAGGAGPGPGPGAALLAVLRAAAPHLHPCDDSYHHIINIGICVDEASLWEICQILILAPEGYGDTAHILQAMQIMFSRSDVDPKLLSLALIKFENILKETDDTDDRLITDIINRIEKLRSRVDVTNKDSRILHREVIMFLGKYGNDDYIERCTEDTSILKMRDLMVFSLPDTYEGVKINLQGLFELAVGSEQPEALRALLNVIYANWDATLSRAPAERTAAAHRVVVRLMHALCRAEPHARAARPAAAVRRAALTCRSVAAVLDITACISGEVSPGVRGMLCLHLEELLVTEPGAASESLLAAVAERAVAMMTASDATTVRAGLDITKSLITALKGNNDLTQEYLPKVLIITTKLHTSHSHTIFNLASEAFTEDFGLFSTDALNNTSEELIKTILTTNISDLNVYKDILRSNFLFLQIVYNVDKVLQLVLDRFDSTVNSLLAVACLKGVFQFDLDVCRKILSHNECVVMNTLFGVKLSDDLTTLDAVCTFLKEYSVILLELQYEKTLQYIADLIKTIKPRTVFQIKRILSVCLNTYKTVLKKLPTILTNAFEDWYRTLDITNINIKKILNTPEQAVKIQSLKIFNDIFGIQLYETKKCTATMLQLFKINYFRGIQLKTLILSDILSVSVSLLTLSDIKSMFFSSKPGMEFCRTFINVYFEKLIEKPFVLLDLDGDSCLLLLDVVECCLKRKCPVDSCGRVMELVDELWPKFVEKSSFSMKQTLVKHLFSYPNIDAHCGPVRWAVGVVGSAEASALDKIRVIGLLKAGAQFSACYLRYASRLPTRMSEMRGEHGAMLRGLLAALAATGDAALFDILVTLAAGDDTKGWWDEALDSCMSALALKADHAMYQTAYTRCWHGLTLGVCNRILVPLLRYSSPRFCEEYLSGVIKDVFSVLRRWPRQPAAAEAYHKCLVGHVRALSVLQVVFEKVPPESLESANSVLHRGLELARPWACVSEACKLCLALREKATCPADATSDIKQSCRLLQCATYNCLTAAICRRRPDERFYTYIFDAHAWASLVDSDAVYKLPLQPTWRRRSTQRHAVSIDVAPAPSAAGSARSLTAATLRTRLYLRTLSENPLQYDMIQQDEDDQPSVNQEIQLSDSELNSHECSATLAALLGHAAALDHTQWRVTLSGALVGGMHKNAKWILAQAICNTEAVLNPHSNELVPALFRLVADTGDVAGDVVLLNGLHLDVITAITNWNENCEITDKKYLNATIEYLIATCIHHRHWHAIYRTLLECLDRLLKLYGNVVNVPWTVFEKYFKDIPTDASYYLQILYRILKHNIHMPELLPTLLASFDAKHWRATPKLAEVFGMAINACPGREKEGFLDKFRAVLDKIRSSNVGDYIKVLYSSQKCCNGVCDEKHFKIISDLAPKIEKPKCLSILSSRVSHHSLPHQLITDMLDTVSPCEVISSDQCPHAMELVGCGLRYMDDVLRRRAVMLVAGYCDHASADVRRAAFRVVTKAFEELFPPEECPPAKRIRTDQSRLLIATESDEQLVKCVLNSVSRGALRHEGGALREQLHDQLTTRLAECFYITVYIPAVSNNNCDLSVCVSVLLELLFDREHSQEVAVSPRQKAVTNTKTYQGTFRSLSSTNTQTNEINNATDAVNTEVDIPMSNIDILNTLLHFSKINTEACKTLCVEVLKTLKAEGRGFDLESVMSKHLAHMLMKNPNNLTPFVLETSRVFIDSVSNINGFKESVETLKKYTKGSEGIGITTLLYEEVMLRCGGAEQFELGLCKEESDDYDMGNEEFCLEDLISAFGKLSNWDDLRIQDKRRVLSGLPVLWTDKDDFRHKLDQYVRARDDTQDMSWFDKMAVSSCEGGKRDGMRWLREMEQWPRRPFVVSAVTEAVSRPEGGAGRVPRAACLAQCAARLMIRSAHLTQSAASEESQTSAVGAACRAQELAWCVAANDRSLPALALQCIKRNKGDLHDNETLSWLQQKVLAMRTMGLAQNDGGILKNALTTAEKCTPMFSEYSSPAVIIGMEKLILQLNYDLKSLSKSKVDGILREVATCNSEYAGWTVSRTNAQVLKSLYDLAIIYYDDLWTDGADEDNDVIISSMADVIGHQIEHNLTNNYDVLFSIILNKLDSLNRTLSEATARNLLDKLQRTIDKLDSFTTEHIHGVLGSFPAGALKDYPFASSVVDPSEAACKQYLRLISDAAYTLWHYVEMLHKAIKANDAVSWKSTFDTMKAKIFENPYAGSDYKLLTKYKSKLYALYNYNNTSQTSRTLLEIKSELSCKPARATIRLSQLCPALRSSDTLREHETALRRLLAIPHNVTIVKFYDEVSVYTDSARRACVLSALRSDGRAARRLRKAGDCLRADAALQRAASAPPALCARAAFRGYSVTPLSEDCGLIEYLEDHERLLTLMLPVHNLDDGVSRPSDGQLILSPAQSLQTYRQICAKTPSYVLRSAIEQHSASTEDFIAKKRNFVNTLSSMAVISWIFGVGDRHLANIMYNIQDGGVCGVDWNTVLQYGSGELPPARLTRNLLAVGDAAVLESRIQELMLAIRQSSKLYLHFIKQSFRWMAEGFHDKFNYIRDTLEGKTLAYLVTKDALQKSKKMDKEKYIQLLDQVFEKQEQKQIYSVEEQVSCFLRQCTDQRILSVTRRGWQPWV